MCTGDVGEGLRCISSKGGLDNFLLDLRDCIDFLVMKPLSNILGKSKAIYLSRGSIDGLIRSKWGDLAILFHASETSNLQYLQATESSNVMAFRDSLEKRSKN